MLKTIKQNILQWWNELDKKYFLGMLLFSSFVFFPLVSQRLTNAYDGILGRRVGVFQRTMALASVQLFTV